jgi:hypothetical protein
MMKLFKRWVMRWLGVGRVLDLPALCPRAFSLEEVRGALSGQGADAKVQAMLQVVAMQRGIYLQMAQAAAQRGEDPRYAHGAMAGLEDALAELSNILLAAPASDDLRLWFRSGTSVDVEG